MSRVAVKTHGGGNRNDQGPPDIDEALKKLKEKLSVFGGGGAGNGSKGPSAGNIKSILPIAGLVLLVVWGLLGVFQVDEKGAGGYAPVRQIQRDSGRWAPLVSTIFGI
jgi:membrane protease subunit HflK